MLAFWCNYGSLLHLHGKATYIVPLTMQCLPAICLFVFVGLCHESPRFLAKADKWDQAEKVLTTVRQLPASHEYIRAELGDIATQLEHERALIGGASFMDLQREMWLIPGNRKRALISIGLMICQQMTGTSIAAVTLVQLLIRSLLLQAPTRSTTTLRRSSLT